MISVIVPAYNSEKTIGNCVEALMQQDYKMPFEVIVVDDGSKDYTSDAAEELGAIVLKQKNAGPAKARNLGARNANGEILLFTDADCVPEKNWLSEMVKPFVDQKVIGVQGAYKTRQKSVVARFNQIEIEERYEKMKKAKQLDWVGSYSAAYRTKDFFEAKGFDESFPKASGEDPELSYKLAKIGKKLVFNPSAIVYHTHPASLLHYLKVKFFRAFFRVNLYSKHKDKVINDSYTTHWIKFQLIAGYAGIVFFLFSLVLAIIGQILFAAIFLFLSGLIGALGLISTLQFTFYAWKKDKAVAIASLLIIPLRTIAFQLGLIAGFSNYKMRAKK